jgi:hypothetical protein
MKFTDLKTQIKELKSRSIVPLNPTAQHDDIYPYLEEPCGPVWLAPGYAMHPLAFLEMMEEINEP